MRILVCLDGEPHTDAAIERAIGLAKFESAEIAGLHVVDTWLAQFSSEIYAQGREAYLEYVDECLAAEAAQIEQAFAARCAEAGFEAGVAIRRGDPLEEILAEVRAASPDLVVTGGKKLGAWGRFKSRKLPERLGKRLGGHSSIVSIETRPRGLDTGLRAEPVERLGVAR